MGRLAMEVDTFVYLHDIFTGDHEVCILKQFNF